MAGKQTQGAAARMGATPKKTGAGKGSARKTATKKTPTKEIPGKPAKVAKTAEVQPKLLSGGNPQVAKADGDAPVQAYIAAMPGWKRNVGEYLDALIEATVPDVQKAVRWNSPFYGVAGRGWFLSFHCFTKYVKVTFLRGARLRPLPPGESRHPDVRYLDIREDDPLDDKRIGRWIKQASKLPGDPLF